MKSSPRFLHLIGGLTLLTIVTSMMASFAIATLMPAPDTPPMSLQAALSALRDPGAAPAEGLQLEHRCSRIDGSNAKVVATTAAAELGVPDDQVYAAWSFRGAPGAVGVQVLATGTAATIDTGANGKDIVRSILAAPGVNLPAFNLGVRQPDGCWLTVGPSDLSMHVWRMRIMAAFLLSALLLAPLAWWVARRLSSPLRDLARAAEQAALDRPGVSLLARGAGKLRVHEVDVAAAAMDAMQARLRSQAGDVTRMLAAVAHDLRTPLTGLRLRAETAPPDQCRRMVADIARMEAMIVQVLDYARGQSQPEERVDMDIAELVRACVAEQRALGGQVETTKLASLSLRVEPLGLHRAFTNLIGNALRYGGEASVSLYIENDSLVFRVDDAGPGIPEDQIERLQEPFQRLEGSRSEETGGVGLGLAVAHAAATRHGGRLLLQNRSAGGLGASIILPLAPLR